MRNRKTEMVTLVPYEVIILGAPRRGQRFSFKVGTTMSRLIPSFETFAKVSQEPDI